MSKQNMNIPEEIFKAYDIRGTKDQLSIELAQKIGVALVQITGAKRIIVGRDMRENSPELAKNAIMGILSQGAEVVDIGMCTTTIFAFAVSNNNENEAGLMVTASHNPAEYNGFKMSYSDGRPISGTEVKDLVLSADVKLKEVDGVKEIDMSDEYLDYVFKTVDIPSVKDLKVVVDAGNGMSGVTLPGIIDRLDCEVESMYLEPDGTFPNHEPNPVKEETLKDLQKAVVDNQADVGFAFDGDGDRIGLIDDKGRIIPGDITLALFAVEYLKKNSGGKVSMSPNMGWAARDAILGNGGEIIMAKVGRTNVINQLQKQNGLFGGEISGHFFFKEFKLLESSEYAMLLTLKIIAASGKKLSEIIEPYLQYHNSGELNFEVIDKDQVIKSIEDKYRPGASSFSDLDGIRLEFDDWWFNLRKSNTEPIIRLRVETKTKEALDEKVSEIKSMIQ